MANMKLKVPPGNAVVSVQINHDKNYAFVEVFEKNCTVAFHGSFFYSLEQPKKLLLV
jgi:hypothetical protein